MTDISKERFGGENLAQKGETVSSLKALRPYQIVNLLDMLKFYAPSFVKAAEYLQYLVTYSENRNLDQKIEPEEAKAMIGFLDDMLNECKKIGLDVSIDLIGGAKVELSYTGQFQPTYDVAMNEIKTVQKAFHAELKAVVFMMMPRRMVDYYENPALFGEEVANNFQSAAYDIAEAGRCLATDRSTACVLHLMRILELGLGGLAKVFNVPFQHANWNTIIEQIESEIGKLDKAQNRPPNWKDDRKFYSTAANQFRFFKDSWRNYAMHIHDKYTPEEAMIIFISVKAFMAHVATRLKE